MAIFPLLAQHSWVGASRSAVSAPKPHLVMAQPPVEEAVAILLQNEAGVFRVATETLFKILQNVISHPEDASYRTLKRSNETFSNKVASAKGGVRFLRAVGFQASDDDALTLAAAADLEALNRGKVALKDAVKEYSRRAQERRTAADAAAASKLAELRQLSKQNNLKRDGDKEREREALLKGVQIDRADWERQRDNTNFK